MYRECFPEGYAFSSELSHFDTFADTEDTPTFSLVRPVEEKEDRYGLLNIKPWTDSWGSGGTLHEDAGSFEIPLGSPLLPETAVHANQLPTDSVSRASVTIRTKQYSSCLESCYPRLVRVGTYQRYSGL